MYNTEKMATPRTKANVGLTLLILFAVTLATGIILHLKKHGIIIEPRPTIKIVHWVAGIMMVAFATWHGIQFNKMFSNMKKKFLWFWGDTWMVVIFTGLTFITGMIKILSPVKIHNLGLVHYWFGIIMSIFICLHLFRGIPTLVRLFKLKANK